MRYLAILSAAVLAACGAPDNDGASQAIADGGATQQVAAADLPPIVVYKTATCGCCNGWIDHLREAGFTVEARDTRELVAVKRDAGVPTQMSSCHTALVDGYVVEGHVPADVVKRLLAERPDVAGIATPGMPIGSPGMEGAGAKPYSVHSFDRTGNTAVYAEVDPR